MRAEPLTKQDERKLMQELQKGRETAEHQDPRWMHEYWESDNDRVRRQLGFGLR